MEQFKPIKNYEGLYEVSSYGEVKSIARVVSSFKWGEQKVSEKILAQHIREGYPAVALNKKGFRKTHTIHHLVWDQFGNGERNGHKSQVDHIDENKLNNNIENLQLLTASENTAKYKMTQPKTSKYTGVCFDKYHKKWVAQKTVNKKQIKIGRYNTEEKAYTAYQKYCQLRYKD